MTPPLFFFRGLLLCCLVGPPIFAGEWSNRADLPGNARLADLDLAQAQQRYQGRSKAEIESALGGGGRQILVPTADGGWIEWDAGSPPRAQTWVYALDRQERRDRPRRQSRRENRRLLLNFDEKGIVASVGWSCDTSSWR